MATVNAEKLILAACEVRPGDRLSEYGGAVVASAQPSHSYAGVTELTFDGQTGVNFLFFMDYVHVTRPADPAAERDAGPDDDEDEDGQQHDGQPATWDDGEERW